MSATPRISACGLTKAFALRKRKKVKGIATDSVAALGYLLRQTLLPSKLEAKPKHGSPDFLFAIDDVSFDVLPGEVLGIIGRNGAGKSTLLKILARVIEPTFGAVTVCGRVVSLLELGIGFAPDLTVRENIQIYGQLAGIPVARIRAIENQILEFSRLTQFRDMALISCPSGSFVQLAFAAMVCLDADIILADEVLTVGDSEFRHASEERIRAVGRSGESVLFVSHDMNAIRRCCTRVVWLDKGRVRQIGPTDQVVKAYTTELLTGQLEAPTSADLAAGCRLLDLRLLDAEKAPIGALQITEMTYIDCVLRVERPDIAVTVQIELWQGKRHVLTSTAPNPISARVPTTFRAGVRMPADFLNDTPYEARCRLHVQDIGELDAAPILASEQTLSISVMNPRPQLSVWSDWTWGRGGVISPRLQWTTLSETPIAEPE